MFTAKVEKKEAENVTMTLLKHINNDMIAKRTNVRNWVQSSHSQFLQLYFSS